MDTAMHDEEGAEGRRLDRLNRAEIARVRREIGKAKRVFLIVSDDYHTLVHSVYVHVSKRDARKIVGLCPTEADPFKLQRQDGDLYLAPAFFDHD